MSPIRIFSGSFGGETLYQNGDFISPNTIRAEKAKQLGNAYKKRKLGELIHKERKQGLVLPEDPLDSVFK